MHGEEEEQVVRHVLVVSEESLLVGGITFVMYSIINFFSDEVINGVPDHPIYDSLDVPPFEDEVFEALGKMKSGKAGWCAARK